MIPMQWAIPSMGINMWDGRPSRRICEVGLMWSTSSSPLDENMRCPLHLYAGAGPGIFLLKPPTNSVAVRIMDAWA